MNRDFIQEEVKKQGDQSFFIFDPLIIERRMQQWQFLLPMVTPFYAMKANPDPTVLRSLTDTMQNIYGSKFFDCASKEEIKTALLLGTKPENIVFSHPVKFPSHLLFARDQGIKKMTFDSEGELEKIASILSSTKVSEETWSAELILRIITDDQYSRCRFSSKFGAPLYQVPSLLEKAKNLGLNIVGVSFHVGSGCSSFTSFRGALVDSAAVFEQMRSYDFTPSLLDIGGGFSSETFSDMAVSLYTSLSEKFPPSSGIKIIAEPGRFFVEDSHCLILTIMGKKVIHEENEKRKIQYTVNDSVYCSLNNVVMDHYKVIWDDTLTSLEKPRCQEMFETTIFCSSCDALDLLCKDIEMPEFDLYDILILKKVGAYTVMYSSQEIFLENIKGFNGFERAKLVLFKNE